MTVIEGNSYDEATLFEQFKGVDLAWVNTNGFAIGEKNEVFWGIRTYEIALFSGVKHFQWASLPYVSKLGGFDPQYRTGHMDGKGRVAEYIKAQPATGPMKWSILSSCMYLEMLTEMLMPRPNPAFPGALVFAAPVGDGTPPLIYLADLGRYARWIFDHPDRSAGLDLQVATESIGWQYLADTFTEVTGKKAVFYRDVTLDQYFGSGAFPDPDRGVGHGVDDKNLMTYRQNFSGFWNNWRDNLVKVDYALLDEILPTRVKTLAEWMRLTDYKGQKASVLKDYVDGNYS